jgi:hypothetical protein
MTLRIRLTLLGLFCCAVGFDAAMLARHRFDIDWPPYLAVLGFAALLLVPAVVYQRVRKDQRIAAMFGGLAFLLAFAPACSLICSLGSPMAGTRIDAFLAQVDRALGFDWSTLIAFAAKYESMNRLLALVYGLAVWQVLVLVMILGSRANPNEIGKICIAIALCGLATSAFWLAFPSFGAVTVFWMPQAIEAQLHATVDNAYGRHLLGVLVSGPGRIDTQAIKGMVGFPSFHTAEALITVLFARNVKRLFVPFAAYNSLNLLACLIQGGHHLIDLIGGLAMAAAAIWISGRLAKEPARSAVLTGESQLTEAGLSHPVV